MAGFPIGFATNQSLQLLNSMVPIGGIISWAGSIAGIPEQYQLCDGTNGTPDLRERFIVGAGPGLAVDTEDATPSHDHAFTGDGHTHAAVTGIDGAGAGPARLWSDFDISTSDAASGTTGTSQTLPPYWALAWIQRMT